jgi:hypothetical protein
MNAQYFANPYDTSTTGFYFTSYEEYEQKAVALINPQGAPVEEFMIDYIDGPDAQLFSACGVDQGSLEQWFDAVVDLHDHEKVALFYLVSVNGQDTDEALQVRGGGGVRNIDDVSVMKCDLLEAASTLFDDIYLQDIPEAVRSYIDYEAFARDCQCGGDMYEFEFNGDTWTCTNANS